MMKLTQLRIGPRLTLAFGALIALLVVIVAIAWFQLDRTLRALAEVRELEQQAAIATEWVGKTRLNIARVVGIAKAGGMAAVEVHFAPEIKRTTQEIGDLQKALEARVSAGEGKALMAEVADRRKAYVGLREDLFKRVKQGDTAGSEALLTGKVLPAADDYLGAMARVQQFQSGLARSHADALQRDIGLAGSALVALLALGAVTGGALAWFITLSITGPLRRGVAAASAISGGDLSQQIDSSQRDESGDLLRALGRMQCELRSLVGQVRRSTDSIGIASGEIASGNQDLSTRTEQTASSLQQAASAMEQLTVTVKLSADSARHANELAASAAAVAARGGAMVSQVVATMDDINASSKRIGDIIGVIDGIAFQTNILALNAAVEAARAGEQGRGFAVVAGEVRSLAARSADAAREIKALIGASVDKVDGGSRLVADAGRTMAEIVGSVQRVSDMIGEITTAASEQSQGLGEVNSSVSQLDRMTQQNAALVEQSAAAAESLKQQAVALATVVSVFRLGA